MAAGVDCNGGAGTCEGYDGNKMSSAAPASQVKISYYSAKLTDTTKVDTIYELKSTVAASISTTGDVGAYCTKDLTVLNQHANKNLCSGGSNKNIMQRFTVKFYEPSSAGSDWQFRFNLDSTHGTVASVDGTSVLTRQGNVWKGENHDMETSSQEATEGIHEFLVIGAEECCDGEANDWEFKRGDAAWEPITTGALAAVAASAGGSAQSPLDVECKAKFCVLGMTVDDEGTIDCRNGGTVTGAPGNCACDCETAKGYEGELCDVISDDCINHATGEEKCKNDAVCKDGVSSFTCACAPGYEGATCATPSNCEPGTHGFPGTRDCKNGGAVEGRTGSCSCNCATASGYEGEECTEPSLCTHGANGVGTIDCGSHGTAHGVTGECSCECDAGYEGVFCGTASACIASGSGSGIGFDASVVAIAGEVACDVTRGDVSGHTGSCKCECRTGFIGKDCSVADRCRAGDGKEVGTIKCHHIHGEIHGTTGECSCDCHEGYHGLECDLSLQ